MSSADFFIVSGGILSCNREPQAVDLGHLSLPWLDVLQHCSLRRCMFVGVRG